jgi:hypothetical protein
MASRPQHDAHVGAWNAWRLEYIRERCRISDDGCWIWSLTSSRNGQPMVGGKVVGNPRRVGYAHRIAWIASGRKLPPYRVLVSTCGHPACANPEHRAAMTRREWEKTPERIATHQRGAIASARITPKRRAGGNIRLSLDIARAIRARYAELQNHTHVAREFGLRTSDVHRIVVGRYWREPSPFPV